jgi:hypothetical protein
LGISASVFLIPEIPFQFVVVNTYLRKVVDRSAELWHIVVMQTPRPRKIINMSLDPDLVDWLHEWRKAQTAQVPFGRAIDACIREFRESRATAVQIDQPSGGGVSERC